MGIVIVNNMLLTGFDAPVEQVMYLDKVIVAHDLLQAIARVNRVGGEAKDKGFVVDYVGVGHHLKKALDNYDEREQNEVHRRPELPRGGAAGASGQPCGDHGVAREARPHRPDRHDAFFDLFYDEDLRFEFMSLFKKFTKCLNVVFPAKEALDYMSDYQRLAEINVLAGKHFRDERLSMKGIPPKLRSDHRRVPGIAAASTSRSSRSPSSTRIFRRTSASAAARRPRPPRSSTPSATISTSSSTTIRTCRRPSPKRCTKIFEEFRDNWNKIYEELEKLRPAHPAARARSRPTGLHRKKQMPFFRMSEEGDFRRCRTRRGCHRVAGVADAAALCDVSSAS